MKKVLLFFLLMTNATHLLYAQSEKDKTDGKKEEKEPNKEEVSILKMVKNERLEKNINRAEATSIIKRVAKVNENLFDGWGDVNKWLNEYGLVEDMSEQSVVMLAVTDGIGSNRFHSAIMPLRDMSPWQMFGYKPVEWFPLQQWAQRVVVIYPDNTNLNIGISYDSSESNNWFQINSKYDFTEIEHDHSKTFEAFLSVGIPMLIKDGLDVTTPKKPIAELEKVAAQLSVDPEKVAFTPIKLQAINREFGVNYPFVNKEKLVLDDVRGVISGLKSKADRVTPSEAANMLNTSDTFRIVVLDITNQIVNPYGHSKLKVTFTSRNTSFDDDLLALTRKSEARLTNLNASVEALEAEYMSSTSNLVNLRTELSEVKQQQQYVSKYHSDRINTLKETGVTVRDGLQAGGDRWSFSLAYAISDYDEAGYTVDNGLISIDADSKKKTPAFITANWHLIPLPDKIEDAKYDLLQNIQPYAFFGFRAEVEEFEPAVGFGLGLRFSKSLQLQGWAGWVYSSQKSLKAGAEIGDQATESNLSTEEKAEFISGLAIGWKP